MACLNLQILSRLKTSVSGLIKREYSGKNEGWLFKLVCRVNDSMNFVKFDRGGFIYIFKHALTQPAHNMVLAKAGGQHRVEQNI